MAEEGGLTLAKVLKVLLEDRQIQEKELAEERARRAEKLRKNTVARTKHCDERKFTLQTLTQKNGWCAKLNFLGLFQTEVRTKMSLPLHPVKFCIFIQRSLCHIAS